MPVTLGDLQYIIEANTRGLDQAVQSIQKLVSSLENTQRAVTNMVNKFDQANKSIQTGARASSSTIKKSSNDNAAALKRQQRALELLREKFDNFRKKAAELNLRPERIASVTKSFTSLEKAIKQGRLSLSEFEGRQQRFNIVLGRGTKELVELEKRNTRAAQSQRAFESASARQISALSRANIKTQETIEVLRRLRGSSQAIKEVENAFKEFQARLSGAPLSALEMAKAQSKFNEALTGAKLSLTGAGTVAGKFRLRMQELSKSVQIALGPLSGVAARITAFTSLTGQANFFVASIVATIIALGTAMFSAIRVGSKAEQQMLALNAALVVTNKSGTITAERIDQISKEMGELNLSSQEANRQIGRIFAASGLPGDENLFRRILGISQGLAEISGRGSNAIIQNSRKVIRLLEDPANNLNVLSEAGIRFNKVQEEVIRSLERSGKFLEAREQILKRVSVVEVAAVAGAEGLAGAFDTLKETITTLLERTAQESGLLDTMTGILVAVTNEIKNLNDELDLSTKLGKLFTASVNIIIKIIRIVAENFDILVVATKLWIGSLVVRKVVIFSKSLFKLLVVFPLMIRSMTKLIAVMALFFRTIRRFGIISTFIILMKRLAVTIGIVQKGILLLGPALAVATKGVRLLSLAILNNPIVRVITLMIALLGALAAGFIIVKEKAKKAFDEISKGSKTGAKALSGLAIPGPGGAFAFGAGIASGGFEEGRKNLDKNQKEALDNVKSFGEQIKDALRKVFSLADEGINSVIKLIFPEIELPTIDIKGFATSSDRTKKLLEDFKKTIEGVDKSVVSSKFDQNLRNRISNLFSALSNLDKPIEQVIRPSALEELFKAIKEGNIERVIELLNAMDSALRRTNSEFRSTDETINKLGERFLSIRNDFAGFIPEILKGGETKSVLQDILARSDDIAESFSANRRQVELFRESLKVLPFIIEQIADPFDRQRNTIQQQINDINLQIRQLGASSEEFLNIQNQLKFLSTARELGIPLRSIEDLQKLTKGEVVNKLIALREELDKLSKVEIALQANQSIKELKDQIDSLVTEGDAIGKNNVQRRISIALQQTEIKLRDLGISKTSLEAKSIIELTKRIELLNERNEQLAQSTGAVKSALGSSLDDFFVALRKGQDELRKFKDVFINVINAIFDELIRLAVIEPIVQTAGGFFSNIFKGALASVGLGVGLGTGGSASASTGFSPSSALSGFPTKLNLGRGFATGGVIQKQGILQAGKTVRPVGESGPEAILPLSKIGGVLGVRSSGGGVQVNVFDQRSSRDSSPVQVTQGRAPDGSRQISIFIKDEIKSMISNGELDTSLRANFGISRIGRR